MNGRFLTVVQSWKETHPQVDEATNAAHESLVVVIPKPAIMCNRALHSVNQVHQVFGGSLKWASVFLF